jgi:hypothetical protein
MFSLPCPVRARWARRVDVLDVCEHEVAGGHDALPRAEERLLAREGLERGVQAGVDAARMRLLEELRHELGLEQRLAPETVMPPSVPQ